MDKRWQMAPPASAEDEKKKKKAEGPKNGERAGAKDEKHADAEDHGGKPSKKATRWLIGAIACAVVLAIAGAVALTVRRHRREARQEQALAEQAKKGPKVMVAKVETSPGLREVTMPGDVRAFLTVELTAKVSGYVTQVLVDKGDRVTKGQVLARIASPETDRQVDATRSTLSAASRLAKRARKLAPAGVMTRQELDNANAQLGVAKAEVSRARSLRDYEIVRAPMDGIVTQRFVDPGALVSGTSAQPLLEISDASKLKVFCYAGQDIAPFLKVGTEAKITFPQIHGLVVAAKISRLSGSLDVRSRSELIELWLDNGGNLLPGLYAQVTMKAAATPLPVVPAEAVVSRGEKLLAATVVEGNKLHFVELVTGINDGKSIEIRQGLKGGELVALAIPSELAEGAAIQPVDQKKAEAQKQQQAQQGQGGQKQQPPSARKPRQEGESHR